MKKILLFGAGKIGRSFTAQLFSRSGYEIIFADIDPKIIELINKRTSYKVITVDSNNPDKEEVYTVKNVSAINLSDQKNIIKNIVEADLISLSVGKRGLLGLSELLAKGINQRYKDRKQQPIDIILAENVRDAADMLREEMKKYLQDVPIDKFVGLVETSIGKMVPIMPKEQLDKDPLAVISEPYNTLIVDKLAFKNGVPDVKGLAPKKNMKAWVDRKIFIHNMGHAVLSYQASYYDPKLIYTWEALKIPYLKELTRKTMLQSMDILISLYPEEFTVKELTDHINDLLERFSNKLLGDTIYRVGRDLSRKLNKDDRLMTPILTGLELKKDFSLILDAWVKGCFFNVYDNQGNVFPLDKEFMEKYSKKPLLVLSDHCKLDKNKYGILYEKVSKIAEGMK